MKLRKKLVQGIAIMVIGMMSVTSFASDLPVLTLEQAISSAIGADAVQQEAYEKSIAAQRQVMMDTDDVATGTYQTSYYNKLETEQVMKYHKDAITYQVTKLYNTIALQQQQLTFFDEKLAMQEKLFTQAEVKYRNGLISKLDYETAKNKIEEQRTAKDKLQAKLDENRANFKQLSKYDTKNYSLQENFEVEYYDYTGNIQYFFNSSVDDMLEYQKKLAEVSDTYIFSDMVKRRDSSAMSYYSGKASAAASKNGVEQTKEARVSTLNTLYSSLQTLKQNIKELEVTIEDQEKKLEALKLKYEKGLVSQIELEQAELNLEELKLNVIECKVNYNATKDAVRKPWVNFY